MITTSRNVVPRWHIKKNYCVDTYNNWVESLIKMRGTTTNYKHKRAVNTHKKFVARLLNLKKKDIQVHHVVPRSIKNNNEINKLIYVTDDEHKFAHFLLTLSLLETNNKNLARKVSNIGDIDLSNKMVINALSRIRIISKKEKEDSISYMTILEFLKSTHNIKCYSNTKQTRKIIRKILLSAINDISYCGQKFKIIVL